MELSGIEKLSALPLISPKLGIKYAIEFFRHDFMISSPFWIVTMTIQQLKNLLQRMFKIKAIDQNLSYFDSKVVLLFNPSFLKYFRIQKIPLILQTTRL